MSVVFRVFEEKDEEEISKMPRGIMTGYDFYSNPIPYLSRLRLYECYGAFVADDNGIAVGGWAFALKRVRFQGSVIDAYYGIDGVISETHRRFGVYQRLFDYAMHETRKWMPNYLHYANVSASNVPGYKVMQRVGMTTIATWDCLSWEAQVIHSDSNKLVLLNNITEVHQKWERFYKDFSLALCNWDELTSSKCYGGTLCLERGEHSASISIWDRNDLGVLKTNRSTEGNTLPLRFIFFFACEWTDQGLLPELVKAATNWAKVQGYIICYLCVPSSLTPLKEAVESVAQDCKTQVGCLPLLQTGRHPGFVLPTNLQTFQDPRDYGIVLHKSSSPTSSSKVQ